MPLLFEDSVSTFRQTRPVFQSRRYAASLTCSATQRPSSLASRPLGWLSGDLKSGSTLHEWIGWEPPATRLAANPQKLPSRQHPAPSLSHGSVSIVATCHA